MTDRKFNDWERVVHKASGDHGVVECYDAEAREYIVRFDDGEEGRHEVDQLRRESE